MSRPMTLLFTGLTMQYSKKINPEVDFVRFGKILDDSLSTLNHIPNFYYQHFELDPDAASDALTSLASLKKLVRQGPPQGGSWDAQFIGVGVKRIPELTPLFEDIINTIVEESGGKSKFLFSTTPNDHWDVVKRVFPNLGLGQKPTGASK